MFPCTLLGHRVRQDSRFKSFVAHLYVLGSCFFLFTRARKLFFLIYTCKEAIFFLFTLARNFFFHIYTCKEPILSYLHVQGSYFFLFARARKLFFLIYTCKKTIVSYLHV